MLKSLDQTLRYLPVVIKVLVASDRIWLDLTWERVVL